MSVWSSDRTDGHMGFWPKPDDSPRIFLDVFIHFRQMSQDSAVSRRVSYCSIGFLQGLLTGNASLGVLGFLKRTLASISVSVIMPSASLCNNTTYWIELKKKTAIFQGPTICSVHRRAEFFYLLGIWVIPGHLVSMTLDKFVFLVYSSQNAACAVPGAAFFPKTLSSVFILERNFRQEQKEVIFSDRVIDCVSRLVHKNVLAEFCDELLHVSPYSSWGTCS